MLQDTLQLIEVRVLYGQRATTITAVFNGCRGANTLGNALLQATSIRIFAVRTRPGTCLGRPTLADPPHQRFSLAHRKALVGHLPSNLILADAFQTQQGRVRAPSPTSPLRAGAVQ